MYKDKSLKGTFVAAACAGALFAVSLILYVLCRTVIPAEAVSEFYTDVIFYYISWPLKAAVSYFPFSFAEIFLYVSVISFAAALVITVIHTVSRVKEHVFFKKEGTRLPLFRIFRPSVKFITVAALFLCLVCSAFILFGGLNYTSLTFYERSGYSDEEYSVSQLTEICRYLSEKTSEARANTVRRPGGMIDADCPGYNIFTLTDDAVSAYGALPDEFDSLKRTYPRVKPAISSYFMSNIHLTGIYPYIIPEAVVNAQTPVMSLPHTICHEMAHQRGFAREDEANYIAYLACIHSDNPLFVYSGYYTAFSYAMNQLIMYDTDAWNEIASDTDRYVWADMSYENTFWAQFDTVSSEFTESVNDTYLNVMDVDDGVHSYGRMVDLLIAGAIRDGIIE